MHPIKAQGAIESSSRTTAGTLRAQGATEYLVLLAVVLIVALVSVALLGFFPGMASDAQMTQSQAYWQSASPIAITEWDALPHPTVPNSYAGAYLRLKNNGAYKVKITKLLAGANSISQAGLNGGGLVSMDIYLILAPGDEKSMAYDGLFSGAQTGWTYFWFGTASTAGHELAGVSSLCSAGQNKGTLNVPNFGFEYIEYIDNQPITKREIGKPLIIKCS